MYKTQSIKMRGIVLAAVIVLTGYVHILADSKPGAKRIIGDPNLVAEAGLTRYVAEDPITLDGRGSYGPESWGELTHQWRQISGPSVTIDDPNSVAPTISGFVQTSEVHTCVFELVVRSGDRFSEPDTVEAVIVPDFGESTLLLGNEWFDPDKPTFIFFNGGSTCSIGGGGVIDDPGWLDQVNSIGFSSYQPDAGSSPRTFYQYGDMIIVFLSSVVKDYRQPIHSAGFSAGGTVALDVGIRLNLTYQDARFALNCAILIDGGNCLELRGNPPDYVNQYLSSSVDGEACWIQSYNGANKLRHLYPNVLNVDTDLSHGGMANWYFNSFAYPDMNIYNGGVVAGAYWSPLGPGRNLHLAQSGDAQIYFFKWYGTETSGYMDFYNESLYPARLPEPVELVKPVYVEDDRSYLLTCEESENAVGYELLVGSDPYSITEYELVSDGPARPNEPVRPLFFESDRWWWTVRARDQYGSTIHSNPNSLQPTLGILDLYSDGQMNFRDFAELAGHWSEDESSVDLAPGPLGDGKVDIRDVAVMSNYWLADLRLATHWKLDEEEGEIAHDSIGANDGTVHGDPNWLVSGGELGGALELDGTDDYVSTDFVFNPADYGPFSVFVWVKGGTPEEVVLSQTDSGDNDRSWLATDSAGNLMTYLLRSGRGAAPLISDLIITDGDWHRIGLVCDGSYRRLYADGAEVAADSMVVAGIIGADGGLHIGVDSALSPASFWTGLIDDVRIYDQTVTP